MIGRRHFVRASGLALAALSSRALAQKGATIPRIGMLAAVPSTIDAAFVDGLRELGYAEGRNIVIERRSADGDYAKLPSLAAELVTLKPSLIAAIVTQPSIAAKEATSTVPVVIVAVSDPVVAGIVGNLARPGGNVTGTALHLHDSVGKQVELARQVVPKVRRIVVLWNPDNVIFQQQSLGTALIASSRVRIVATPIGVRSRADIERVFGALDAERPDAMLVLSDPMLSANRARLAELAIAHRMPTFSGFRLMADGGLLACYGPDLRASARQAAEYVRKILNGARPGELPIELPTKSELVVNLRTAQALGIEVPASVLARANDVIR